MDDFIAHIPTEFLVRLNMNGLKGRMLKLPAPKHSRREFLLVYGQHASLENVYGLASALNDFGSISLPDLPGFGGMDSFYKISEKPNIDRLADYLAAFVKLRYKQNRRFCVVGIGLGFAVATRMLQRYPEIAARVDFCISITGVTHFDDINLSRGRRWLAKLRAQFLSLGAPAFIYRSILLHPRVIRARYAAKPSPAIPYAARSQQTTKEIQQLEVYLWRLNDLRTHMATTAAMLKLNNCKLQVGLPVWHIALKNDQRTNDLNVGEHLSIIFKRARQIKAKVKFYSPAMFDTKNSALAFLPKSLTNVLSKETQ